MQACRLERTDYTPVWLMRQAGRFMKSFRDIRAKVEFLDLCKNSALAAEVTVMAVERLQVDAAIIFADILLPIEPMGIGLEYLKGEGPHILRPLRTEGDVRALQPVDVQESLGYVIETVKLARQALPAHIPLIGFAAAPFTLASYMIEGGSSKNFQHTKTLMYSYPQLWQQLMDYIADITVRYLNAQIDAGAQAVQVFDSWVGCVSPSDYAQFVLPATKKVFDGLPKTTAKIHFGTGTAGILDSMKAAGGDVIGLDWRVNLYETWQRLGYNVGVQGNLDPTVLFSDRQEISKQVARIMREADGRAGHIFNLGHGVLPETDEDLVKYLVEEVHARGRQP